MKYLHPDLGVELPERSYGADCRIYVPENPTNRFKNVYDTVFDEFVLAHILGWWGKAIMIRNQPLLWVLSIGFESMELTFRHMLPNFNECWWDSIVLDILICNWFGIWAGMRTVRYFDGRTYEWVGISQQPNIIGKVKRTLGQFTPAHWDKDEWHPLLGPWRFLQVLSLCVVFLTVELNTFFLKFCLWVPPQNPLIIYRLVLWWLIAIPTIREYNSYLQDRAMESLVCSRTRRVEDDHPQAGVIPSLFAASVWCSNDDVHPAYPYQESPLVLALPVPNHHDQEEIRKLSVCSTTTTVEYHPQDAVNPPLSTASVWCFNDDVHPYPYPLVLALPVPSHHHHQEEITKLTLFTGSQQVDHSTAQSLFPCAPRIEDHLPIKKRKRFFIIVGSKKPGHPNTLSAPTIKHHLPINNHHLRDNLGSLAELIHAASSLSLSLFPPTKKINIGPKKPIKNHHWDDELIDAASSLSLSLPTKRKRLINIGPKKPQNNSIQVEDEGVIIAKKQKVVVDKTSPRNHHHWIHKRLSKSDVNLSSRLLLPKEEITKYVLPLMNMESCRACQNKNGLRVKIWDLDTESEHELSLKQWVTGSFLLTSNWNTEFVKRRSLHEGDTISMCWDFENLRFLFRKFNA